MQKINCNDCEKKNCPQRIEDSLCSLNKNLQDLIVVCESRDPKLMASKMAQIMGSEMERYDKAVRLENIGEEVEVTFINKKGEETTVRKPANINPAITQLAHSIVKNGKIINDILNPPKLAPLYQQNNQYNFGSATARVIESQEGEEKIAAIKFLDERINDLKQGS